MKKNIVFVILVLISIKIFSYNNILEWRYIKDNRFTVYYPQGQYLYAKYVMNTLNEYSEEVDQVTGNQRQQNLNIVLEDTGEFYNGMANPIENRLSLFLNTPNTHDSITFQEWLNTLVIHEYTHHSHLTNAKKYPLVFSKIFGNIFSPNLYSPMWIIEGITVRNESNFSPYMGRLNNGYYKEIIEAQLREDRFQNHITANYYLNDFPFGNYYVYGGAFIEWLAEQYGEEKLTEFFNYYGSDFRNVLISSLLPKYTLDKAAKRVFNKRFPQLFAQWKDYIKMSADFDKTLVTQNIAHNWNNTLLVNNLTTDDVDNLYFFETKGYFNHYRKNIVKYNVDNNSSKIIYNSNSSLSANLEIRGNMLYFSEVEGIFTGNNLVYNGYSGTSTLKKLDLNNRNSTKVIFQKNFKDFTVAENRVIFYTTEDINSMTSSLFMYANNHHSLIRNYPFLISELVYSKNKIFCTYKYPNSSWDIGEISLSNYDLVPLVKTKSQEKNIHVFNNILLFTSNQNNKSQAYKLDLSSKKISKVSNNFFADMPKIIGNKLYYKSISATGERISVSEVVDLPANLELVDDSRLITIIDDDYEETLAVGQSLKQLFIPYIRQPLGILTSDGIGLFKVSANWYLNNDNDGVFEADISTQIFSPLNLNYHLTNHDDNYLNAQLRLYSSQVNWLSSIDIMGLTDFADTKLLGNRVLFRKFNSILSNTYNYDFESTGSYNNLTLRNNFKRVQLSTIFQNVNDYDKSPNFSEKSIKSAHDTFNEYGVEAEFNLFKIRNGWWTPNIAVKDIDLCLGIYQNDYRIDDKITYFKISSKSELFAANVLDFVTETGIYFNNKKISPIFKIGVEY